MNPDDNKPKLLPAPAPSCPNPDCKADGDAKTCRKNEENCPLKGVEFCPKTFATGDTLKRLRDREWGEDRFGNRVRLRMPLPLPARLPSSEVIVVEAVRVSSPTGDPETYAVPVRRLRALIPDLGSVTSFKTVH